MGIGNAFDCYGHFYDLFFEDKKIAACRSVLEIIKKSSNISDVDQSIPNAVVIMMNPGMSYPKVGTAERIDLENFETSFNSKTLTLAFPDITQIRIMKLMKHKNWNHVRVINLSDLREVDSKKLKRKIQRFELITSKRIHSIFSDERQSERERALSKNTVPILLAWGVKDFLEEIAAQCLFIVSSRKRFGVPSKESKALFHHPLTRRVSWYTHMVNLLENCK